MQAMGDRLADVPAHVCPLGLHCSPVDPHERRRGRTGHRLALYLTGPYLHLRFRPLVSPVRRAPFRERGLSRGGWACRVCRINV